MVRRQKTLGGPCLPAQEVPDHRGAVGRVGQRLPHLAVRQNRIVEIESDVGDLRAGLLVHDDAGFVRKRHHHVRRQRRHSSNIGRAFAKFKRPHDRFRHNAKSNASIFGTLPK